MNDIILEVRQSKVIIILCVICVCIFESIGVGGVVLAVKSLSNNEIISFEEYTGNIFGFCFSLCLLLIFLLLFIYIFYNYKKQKDMYTNDKMYRKKGDKIIFEIPYKNIVNIKYGFESVFFFLKEPIVKTNGKPGPRNFYAHYSKYDIDQIIHIINSDYLR